MSRLSKLLRKKTTWAGVGAVAAAGASYTAGEMPLYQALFAALMGSGLVTLSDRLLKPDGRIENVVSSTDTKGIGV
jgi:hypothetical protein